MLSLPWYLILVIGVPGSKHYTDNVLLRYNFHTSNSQIVEDVSGNECHGTNGNSLSSESSDVIWTDRGGYFSGNQHVLVTPNSISNRSFLLSRDFTMTLWVYSLSDSGYIAGKSKELGICYSGHYMCYAFRDLYKFPSVSLPLLSKYYVENWRIVTILFSYTSSLQTLTPMYMNTVLEPISFSTYWVDTEEHPFLVGKNFLDFQGFIYDLIIYEGVISNSQFNDGTMYTPFSGSCEGYPFYRTQCLSTCEDPSKNEDCDDCPGTCQACDLDCGSYCSTSDPTDCSDIRNQFCKPSPYDTGNLACNFDVICINNCYDCTNDSECLTCDGSYLLQPDLTCDSTCPTGYYPDMSIGQCASCYRNCTACSGPSFNECLTCSDTNAYMSSGTCVCNDGFFPSSSNPLVCSPCHIDCATCNGSSESDCLTCRDINAFTESGRCRCNEEYYASNLYELACNACNPDCKTCRGSYASDCLSCTEETKTLKEGSCICEERFFESNLGTCEACSSYCKECSGESCSICLESFSLTNGACVCPDTGEIYTGTCYEHFSIEIAYSVSEELNMYSEEPMDDFPKSYLSISMADPESSKLLFSIRKLSSQNFTVDLSFADASDLKNITLNIQFTYPIFSSTGKILKNRGEILACQEEQSEVESEELTEIGVGGTVLLAGAVSAGFLSMVTMDDPSVLWTVADTAQFISYLPLIDVDISVECKQFLLSYQSFYFFPNPLVDLIDKTDAKAPDFYREYGVKYNEFEDIHFLRNGGRFFTVVFVALVVHVLMLLSLLCLRGRLRSKIKTKLSKCLNTMARISIVLYLDLAVFSMVELMDLGSSEYFASVVLTMFVTSLLIIIPIYILLSLAATSTDSEYVRFLKATLTDLRQNSKLTLSFYGLVCLRKLVYASTLYFLRSHPNYTIGVQLAVSLCIILFIFKIKFFAKPVGNIIHGVGEIVLSLTLLAFYAIQFAHHVYLNTLYIEYFIMGLNICFIFSGTLMNCFNFCSSCRKRKKNSRVMNYSSKTSNEEFPKVFEQRDYARRGYSFVEQFSNIDNSNSMSFEDNISQQVNLY